ncbi:hypothetical protein JXB02_04425 [Candidatus Woesearchaeota archaeon]|nr:hypothetical protein [Candidatus Woesearchaeota archaeon]
MGDEALTLIGPRDFNRRYHEFFGRIRDQEESISTAGLDGTRIFDNLLGPVLEAIEGPAWRWSSPLPRPPQPRHLRPAVDLLEI